MNSSKNKLNNKIILIFYPNPNAHLVCILFVLLTSFYGTYVRCYIKCAFGLGLKIKIILLFSLFLLLFMGLTALFGTIGLTILFQLTFIFIYNTFNNNFLVSAK